MDALVALAPVGPGYAHTPVADAFNWAECLAAIEPGEWYLVAFRSIVRDDADLERLRAFDDNAHAEATRAPGFVHYYKGPLDVDGSCLSFCMWTSRSEARSAAARPHHRAAVSIIGETYAEYVLEFLRVRRSAIAATLEFEPYDVDQARGGVAVPQPNLGLSPA